MLIKTDLPSQVCSYVTASPMPDKTPSLLRGYTRYSYTIYKCYMYNIARVQVDVCLCVSITIVPQCRII